MNLLHTSWWFPWLRGVTTKDVFSTFDQHQSRTFVVTAAMKVSRRVTISWSSEQQRTCRIRRQPWLKSWLVGFILYYQRGAAKTRRRSRFLFHLFNNTLDLIKLSLFEKFFFNSLVCKNELTIAKVVQNVPSRKTNKPQRNQNRFQRKLSLLKVNFSEAVFSTCGLSRISGDTGSGRRFSKFVTTIISWREEGRVS